jgi:hypothetical protein
MHQSPNVQLSASVRVVTFHQQRIAVVGNGNIGVGKQTATRKGGQPLVKSLSGSNGSSELRIDSSLKQNSLKTDHPCGAMSQQGGEFRGNVSAPQKFVHLVGCHEPKARGDFEISQYPNAAKR